MNTNQRRLKFLLPHRLASHSLQYSDSSSDSFILDFKGSMPTRLHTQTRPIIKLFLDEKIIYLYSLIIDLPPSGYARKLPGPAEGLLSELDTALNKTIYYLSKDVLYLIQTPITSARREYKFPRLRTASLP